MDTETVKNLKPVNIAIWAITPAGIQLGRRLSSKFEQSSLYLPRGERTGEDNGIPVYLYDRLLEKVQTEFYSYAAHVFIFATGIAVRLIAPLLQSKTKDPAVIVLDEKGYFAISLLSGHIGRANEITQKVAAAIGATPVITTATDLNHLPSIDLLAADKNLVIETPGNIKHVNMMFIKGHKVSVFDPMDSIVSELSETMIKKEKSFNPSSHLICTWETNKVSRETLILRPQVLSIGIGCNRGTSEEEILTLIRSVFQKKKLSELSIRSIASVDIKNNETGLIKAASCLNRPLVFYSTDQLNRVDTIENPSKMAEKYLGVKSVCEAAAILGANKGTLLVPKQKTKNVTLAIAVMK